VVFGGLTKKIRDFRDVHNGLPPMFGLTGALLASSSGVLTERFGFLCYQQDQEH
jgi:hypothetical protein